MKRILFLGISCLLLCSVALGGQRKSDKEKSTSLKLMENIKTWTPQEEAVMNEKATERPFTGIYYQFDEAGTYLCKKCGAPLFRSSDKFDAGCGWPSFDDAIQGAVKEVPDRDGRRTEIVCARCGAHLGHVFRGEGFTSKQTRHCVNSLSMNFTKKSLTHFTPLAEAYFAGGCFWGVEHLLQQVDGVLSVESGYMGGEKENPTYKEVCTGKTGHAETVKVIYDPSTVNYETLAKTFFEIHDPTQVDGQGPDLGDQYRSEIFYLKEEERQTIEKLIAQLRQKGYQVVTKVEPATTFWPAETYHQDYYEHKGTQPYCHRRVKRF